MEEKRSLWEKVSTFVAEMPAKFSSFKQSRKRRKNLIFHPVSKIMIKEVITLDAGESLREVLRTFVSLNISSVILTKNSRPIGIITIDDFFYKFESYDERKLDEFKALKLMSPLTITEDASASIIEVWRTLERSRVRKLPLLSESRLMGMVTVTNIMNYILAQPLKIDNLPTVESCLIRKFIKAKPGIKFSTLRKEMKEEQENFALAFSQERIIGILTSKDVLNTVYSNISLLKTALVEDIMSKEVVTCDAELNIQSALELMSGKNYKRLPVLKEGKVIGYATQEGLLSTLIGIYENIEA